jgi:hypothetical protein
MRLDNPGKYQGIDIGGSCSQQNSRAGIERCAGRQDVIDKHHPLAVDLMPPVGTDTKCTLHVDGAFGLGQPDLLARRTHPPERVIGNRDATHLRDRPGQRCRPD